MTTRRTPLMDISNNDVTSTPVATGSRRKSGRAVKAPEKFIPDAPSSQQGHSSAKRKRDEEDVENDTSDVEEEDEASDGTVDSEIEEAPAPRKKAKAAPRKSAAKKPKLNGTVSHEEAPAVKLPSRPKKAKKVLIADRTATGLYADVFTSGMNAEDVAWQFLAQYADNKARTVMEMVNLVLKSAGCDLQVTEDDVEDPDNVGGRLGDLQTEYTAQNVADYPLVQRAKSSIDFRENLVNFFKSLIEVMHKSGVMYEENVPLIENVHLWFATMTSCTSRPFRHTATLVSLSVTTGLCAMVKYEADQAARYRRQFESENKKGKSANKKRLANFQQQVEDSEKKQEALKDKINEFFETVYVHRYRDIDPKIRTECVEAIGDWINELPSVFLEGTYLRYMGWMLSDTHAPVRHEVIKQLHRILSNDANHGTMRHFIERFRPRMIEIATRDSEPDVRASAVQLASLIRDAGMLEPDDIDAVGKLIFDSEQRVRKAVVDFFIASLQEAYEYKLEELGGEEDLQDLLAVDDEDFDSPRKEWIKLQTLAEILAIYDAEDEDEMPSQVQTRSDSEFLNLSCTESRFTRAAQALYNQSPEVKKWEIIAGYLLFDHSSKPTGDKTERALKEALKPKEKEEIILLEILNAVVKLSVELQAGESEKSTEKSRKKATIAELVEAKQDIQRRLAGIIPRLLKKYGANPKTVTAVLRLEQVLDLQIFQELRQSRAYAKLLDEISMQFNRHADRAVLMEAGAALLHSKNKKYADLEEVTDNKMQSLWEETTSTLRRISKQGEIQIRGSLRESVLTELSHNLARLDRLASISNCVEPLEAEGTQNEPLPINIVLDIVGRGVFEEEDQDLDALEDEVVLSAIRSSMFYFMWKMHALSESIENREEISDIDIDNLKELEETFSRNLISSLSSRATLDPVRLFATGTLLDLRVLFCTLRPAKKSKVQNGAAVESSNEHLQSLVKEIEPDVQQELTAIFDQTEKQFAKKAKKKLAEPEEDDAPADLESEPEDEEDDDEVTDNERHAEILKAEQNLCELTGKLVLAILAQVIDASGPLKGKLRSRIQRNKDRLGSNFKKVVEYLDEPKKKKSHRSKAEQAATGAKKAAQKAKEVVAEEEEEEDDPFAEPDVEEGREEDSQRRELLDDEPAASVAEENDDSDEDDIMGD